MFLLCRRLYQELLFVTALWISEKEYRGVPTWVPIVPFCGGIIMQITVLQPLHCTISRSITAWLSMGICILCEALLVLPQICQILSCAFLPCSLGSFLHPGSPSPRVTPTHLSQPSFSELVVVTISQLKKEKIFETIRILEVTLHNCNS